jgi:hypothetical protein
VKDIIGVDVEADVLFFVVEVGLGFFILDDLQFELVLFPHQSYLVVEVLVFLV